MATQDRAWHPHPMHRPGFFLVGFLQTTVGLAILVATLIGRPWFPDTALGGIMSFLVAGLVAAILLLPPGRRTGAGRLALIALTPALAVASQLAIRAARGTEPDPGLTTGATLALLGTLVLVWAEVDRRRVRIEIEGDLLTVFVKRYRLEHELPLEAVREVEASRTLWGRLWGFGDFSARARKNTMKERITKPVVGETPPDNATRGNGWDEEERFHLIAAHPYKRFRRDLENRILLARMPPKERQEAELADRLAEDLGGLDA